ncbi:MAG: ABC transporter ATP-binding protein [Chloroflexi bacterium]|nr:ABC transporter ATP-binding protein [Chloroflexota bacterium]
MATRNSWFLWPNPYPARRGPLILVQIWHIILQSFLDGGNIPCIAALPRFFFHSTFPTPVSRHGFPREDGLDPLAIDAQALSKVFTTRTSFWNHQTRTTVAVEDISLGVRQGELFGLLGPNGAGKTTTVKMLTTLLLPSAGSARILGFDVVRQTQAVRRRIGFTFGGARGLYGRISALDNLRYFAELYGLEPPLARRRIPELLELVGLDQRGNDRVETFSSGMQQRLHLARALLHDPELIFLDEPTVGIDPVGARELRAIVKRLSQQGKTILLTTHYMAEAEELCERIAIVKAGRIIALDTPEALKQRISGESRIVVQVNREYLPPILQRLHSLDGQITCEMTESAPATQSLCIHTRQPELVLEALAPFLKPQVVHNLEVRNQTLEDVYVAIIQGETP